MKKVSAGQHSCVSDEDSKRIQPGSLAPESTRSRRVVVVPARGYRPGYVKRPHVASLLDDAYAIAGAELAGLRRKVERGEVLDGAEARKYRILAEQVVRLAQEERDQAAADRSDELGDDEILQKLEEARLILAAEAASTEESDARRGQPAKQPAAAARRLGPGPDDPAGEPS